jgi:hypothetical protein
MKNIDKISVLLFFFLTSCPVGEKWEDLPPDSTLKIVNNSESNLLFYHSDSFPDTSLNVATPFFDDLNKEYYTVISRSSRSYPSTWRLFFENNSKEFKLIIFILNKNKVETILWDTIRKNYMILKRYDLSYDDLVRLNWTITYP